MTKHPSAGKPIKITSGPLKDKYFVVIDFLVNQFQGKDIKKIGKAHPDLVRALHSRKLFDERAVFGRLYPTMEYTCVHDSELLIVEEPKKKKGKLKLVEGDDDDTTGTDTGDSETTEPGEPGLDGRSVPSDEALTEVPSPFKEFPSEDGAAGSPDSGPSTEHKGPSEPKPKAARGPKSGKGKAETK